MKQLESQITCAARIAALIWAQIVLLYSDRASHFSNWCDIYKVAKVVQGIRSENYCSRSNTRPSGLLLEFY